MNTWPWEQIDWIATGAMLSAWAAILVVCWNIWRFNQEARRNSLRRRADLRVERNERLRNEIADFIAQTQIQRKYLKADPDSRFDEQRALASQRGYFRLRLLLPPSQGHFLELQKRISNVIFRMAGDQSEFDQAITDLEHASHAVLHVEDLHIANELTGRRATL